MCGRCDCDIPVCFSQGKGWSVDESGYSISEMRKELASNKRLWQEPHVSRCRVIKP